MPTCYAKILFLDFPSAFLAISSSERYFLYRFILELMDSTVTGFSIFLTASYIIEKKQSSAAPLRKARVVLSASERVNFPSKMRFTY